MKKKFRFVIYFLFTGVFYLAGTSTLALAKKSNTTLGVGLGYQVGFFNTDSINFILQRYNDTRSYLSNKMRDIKMVSGLVIPVQGLIGSGNTGLMYEFGFTLAKAKRHAVGIDNSGIKQERQVKVGFNVWNLGLGPAFVGKYAVVAPMLGFEIGMVKVKTRAAPSNEVSRADWIKVVSRPCVSGSLSMLCWVGSGASGFKLGLQPYYRLGFLKSDMQELNTAINPATWANDAGTQAQKISYSGLKLMLMITPQ